MLPTRILCCFFIITLSAREISATCASSGYGYSSPVEKNLPIRIMPPTQSELNFVIPANTCNPAGIIGYIVEACSNDDYIFASTSSNRAAYVYRGGVIRGNATVETIVYCSFP